MYVSTYLDKKNNKLLVSERLDGKRLTTEYPLILEYYIEDENGYYEGTNGKRLKKVIYNSANQTHYLLQQYKETGVKTYELTFNLTNKVLYKYYKDSKAPELHKSFFDIEVDRYGFEHLTVKELVDKACCPINAVSIYNNWQDTLFTLMLCPENIPFEEAQKICSTFENTVLFKDEKDLLNGIILLLEDSDSLVGWNSCIPLDSSIWLPTKIIQMKDVKDGMELVDSTIKKVSNVNIKDKYEIKLFNGRTLHSSKEHVFPVYEYDKEKYFNINKNRTPILQKDMSVEDIINGMDKNSYFVKIKKHNNTNRDFTYRDFVLTYLDNLLDSFDFDFVDAKEIKMDYTKSNKTQKCYSTNMDYYTKDRIIDYINDNKHLTLKNYKHTVSFDIDLDEIISDEYFHILGLIYTDGSFYKKKNTITFYNSNKPIIDKVGNIFEELYSVKREKSNPEYNVKGVYKRRITRNSKFGLLLEFIYEDDNKKIDLYALSKVSKKQFMAFMSGCIDGDGWISQNKIGFCNYNNDIKFISELLLWNGYMTSELNNVLLFSSYDNSKLINDLDLWVDYKSELLHNSLFTPTKKESTAKSKLTKYREDDVFWYVQIRDITLVEKNVEMLDICTSTSYFYTHGVKTHNCYFDIPYIVRRIENVLGKGESKRINLWDIEPYMKEKTNQFGDKNITYELYGKISVDYLELYKKHERSKKDSYKLDNIAEIELGEKKVQHDESLDDMYRQRYEDFIKYNRQDTLLVKKLDDKLKYINIHNRQCHSICCTFESTMGTVSWVDQAIINSCHEIGQCVQDRDDTKGQEFQQFIAPGAFVPTPVTGLHNNIMSFDMASLYPNTCIALNMSSESIVGQVRLTLTKPYLYEKIETNNLYKNKGKKLPDWGAAWANEWGVLEYREIMNQTDTPLILDIEGGGSVQKTAKELYKLIFADGSNLNISAFGTIFRTDKEGRVSSVFKQWYAQRKKYKKKMGYYEDLESGVKVESKELINAIVKNFSSYGNTIGDVKEYDVKLLKELVEKTNVDELCPYMKENDLELSDDGRIISKHIEYFQEQAEYWDVEQYIEKIKLNSSYGTLLNTSSTFYDFRFGSSITMTGRLVWKHLASKTNELISGEYKYDGSAIRTGDTDSCYASIDSDDFRRLYPNFDYSKESIIEFSNKVGKDVNDSFPQYMIDTFHCTPEGAAREGAAREVVASRALVCGKKRYAMMVYEKDGYRQDINGKPGKAKIMGIQVARSDTHPLVKELLKKMLNSVLTDGSKEKLVEIMRDFGKKDWSKLNAWDKGTPRTVNKLDFYTREYNKSGKCSVGQVMASINWNRMLDMMGDKKSPKILDGDKVIVCKMKPNNPFGYKSIALPNTITRVPKWFKQLPFDEQTMADSVVDKTIETVFGVLNWDLRLSNTMDNKGNIDDFLTFV